VGDHDHDRPTALELSDGSLQCRLALSIEIGICFVENDQKRIAVWLILAMFSAIVPSNSSMVCDR
jgi:hypothetical protein